MTAYILPNFNITVAFWRNGVATSNPPAVTSPGNLSPGRIVSLAEPEQGLNTYAVAPMWLRLPKGTDAQDFKNGVGGDTCEAPYQSGRFYQVSSVDDIGGGFANEHRFAVLKGMTNWPTPFPPVGGFTPIVPPGPPTFNYAWSTGNVPVNMQNVGLLTSPGDFGGFLRVWDTALVPAITWNGFTYGPQVIAGWPVGPSTFGMHNEYLYYFKLGNAGGTSNLIVQLPGMTVAIMDGLLFSGLDPHNALTPDATATGGFGPPMTPFYAPPSVPNRVHVVCAGEWLPAAISWAAPFTYLGGFVTSTVGGNPTRISAACYPAVPGGVFQGQETMGGFAPYNIGQFCYAP